MDPAHFEAAKNGDVKNFPFCDIEKQDLSEIFNKVSPSGDSLLHVASSFGHEEMTELIARNFPFLILKKNSEGNTALHLVVRAQKLNTVRILVNLAKQIPNTSNDTLLTMKNDEGNTALHESLYAKYGSKKNVDIFVDIACYLVFNDPNVCCHQNNAGKSPLSIAIESGNKDILEYIFNALPRGNNLIQRLEGKSPVHTAIEHKQLEMLRIIKEQKEELLHFRDEEGNNPLHFAAYKGYIKGVRYLVEINSSWATERNNEGFYPLHLACEKGHIKVTKTLFRKWPDPAQLLSNEGQNILHVAAKSGKDKMVRCVLKEKGTDELVNKMDKNGNTPFHLAALHGHSMTGVTLLFDKRSKADLVNYQGLTAYDIFKSSILKVQDKQIDVEDARNVNENSPNVDVMKSFGIVKQFQMMMAYSTLYMYHEFLRRWLIRPCQRSSSKMSRIKIKPPIPKQHLNNTINYLFVVAALVIGTAFSGALQIPFDSGKDIENDSGAPAPSKCDIETKKHLLGLFLWNNVATMSFSLTAAVSLFLALLLDHNFATLLVSVAFLLLELALNSMGSAYYYAMLLRMEIVDGSSIVFDWEPSTYTDSLQGRIIVLKQFQMAVVIISIVAFTLGREALALIIYFILFCFYYPLYRLWGAIYLNPLRSSTKLVIYGSILFLLFTFLFGRISYSKAAVD